MSSVYAQIKEMKISELISGYTEVKRNGSEHIALCPFHADTKPSLTISNTKGIFHCFSCGATGDNLEFVKKWFGVGKDEAIKNIASLFNLTETNLSTSYKKPQVNKNSTNQEHDIIYSKFCPHRIEPGDSISIYSRNNKTHNVSTPIMTHHFLDDDGNILGIEVRIMKPTGKITPIIRYGTVNGKETWIYKGFDGVPPLYNAHLLKDDPISLVLVEGAKCADALTGLGIPALTWSNGVNYVDKVDFSKLAGRNVYLWPDNDAPGKICMDKVGNRLIELKSNVRMVHIPNDLPAKYDAADMMQDGATYENILEFIKNNQKPFFTPKNDEVNDILDEKNENEYAEKKEQGPKDPNKPPFRILGYNETTFYYMAHDSSQITELSPASHTAQNLLMLANLEYWQSQYEGARSSFNVLMAANALMQQAKYVGLFNANKVRGRGAWIDNGRVIIHEGEEALVDGVRTELHKIKSNYIYHADYKFNMLKGADATDEDSGKLLDICNRLGWERKISGELLAGWIAISAVCGALKWRPHIWITGPAGAGKSTIMDSIIHKIIGDIAVKVDGSTTEAAIRGTIRRDARPVIFDEAENEDKKSETRMDAVIALMRAGSSGGEISKGSSNHKVHNFTVRSCFCLASINTAIKHAADESRLTKLTLIKNNAPNAQKTFRELEIDIVRWIDDDFSSRMINRSINNINVLLENAKTFSEAASIVMASRRIGDQIGTLLAGAHLCKTIKVVTYQEAYDIVKNINWDEHVNEDRLDDNMEMIIELFNHNLKIQYKANTSTGDRSVGQALSILAKIADKEELEKWDENDIVQKLRVLGILITEVDGEKRVMFAINSPGMAKALKNTKYANDIRGNLKKSKGAVLHNATKYFSSGVNCRGFHFPISMLGEIKPGDDEEEET